MLFVLLSVVFTVMNWVFYKSGKNYALFMGLALACTAFAMCGEYHSVSQWIVSQDWDSLSTTVPSIEKLLWISVASFSFINILPAILAQTAAHTDNHPERLDPH